MSMIFYQQNLLKPSRGIYFCILHFAVCILTCGCFNPFSPSVIGPSVIKPIAPQVSPDSVLYNFKYAYENRDSIVYENCLDQDFIFTYWDQVKVGEGEVETEFLRIEDLQVTKALFRFFDDIRLDKWKVEQPSDSSDSIVGEEIWKRRSVSFELLVWDTNGDYNYQSLQASGHAEFFSESQRRIISGGLYTG